MQLGVDADPVQNALVTERVRHEQPGLLGDLALLVLNVAAIALAAETGGLSLVAAAAVNVGVTASHVEEYLTKQALVGTAFDKAHALSREDPSLFWLAFEIVGTGIDVGTAAVGAFKTLAPLVKGALAAKEGSEAEEAIEAVRIAAKDAKDAETAEKIVAQVRNARKGEGTVVKGLEEESKLLQEAGKIEAADEIGEGLKSATGEVHLSKAGHIFTCASPCEELAAKYAEIFAKDEKLTAELTALDSRAKGAAQEMANAGGDASKLAEAEQLANKVKEDAAALEARLLIRKAHPEIKSVTEIESTLSALGPKYKILQDAGLDAAAVERVLAKSGNLDHLKGQLLEELLASRVKSKLGTVAGKAELEAKLADQFAGKDLEFIEGYRITDATGQQLTDGMIVAKEGEHYRVAAVFESKAGRASSRGLGYSYKALSELTEEQIRVLRMEAIEELRAPGGPMAGLTTAEIEKLPDQIEKMMKTLAKGEAGQIRKDIERLVPNAGEKVTTILKDGKPFEVTAGQRSTKAFGVLPADVSGARLTAKLQEKVVIDGTVKNIGLNFEAINLDIQQKELVELAKDLAEKLVKTL